VFAVRLEKRVALALFSGWVLLMIQAGTADRGRERSGPGHYRFHVVFNNVAGKKGLETSLGFACLVEGPDETVLFDTGGSGDVLLANMKHMGLGPAAIDAVVLSHIHGDHTGGLAAVLSRNSEVTVYIPESFPTSFRQKVERLGAKIEAVSKPRQLVRDLFSTGEMGSYIKEQALIVDTAQGLVVITGCAHPGIAEMAAKAKAYLGKDIYLLMGGFHLGARSDAEIRGIIRRLKKLGVKKVAPSHCTGENAIRLFREQWADDFVEGGLGAVLEVPR
jgi:7,8-dihydropterin-6-yl-methyl-4-(beta-D-ribofuranosyl)aminobenzene 5'-phosphate synthase